jgi:uncharacterized protein YgiM (DUF1202 family)
MRVPAALLLALSAFPAAAETLYVTQRLEAGVFAQPTLEGDRTAVIHGGDAVELLNREGESALVRLADGSEGWISAALLDSEAPASARLEALAEENEQLRAAARTQTGAGAELKTLQDRNARLESELASARREVAALEAKAAIPAEKPDDEIPVEPVRPAGFSRAMLALWLASGIALALALGFWWGYRTLEQRVRRKYGGLKVY